MARERVDLLFLMLMVVLVKSQDISSQVNFPGGEGSYNNQELPPHDDDTGPFLVQASVNIRNLVDLREVTQDLTVDMSVNLFWYDTRVEPNEKFLHGRDAKGRYLTLTPKYADMLWTPDVYIENLKDMRGPSDINYFVKPISMRMYEDGLIRYSSRINFDIDCPMDFHKFPFDKQVCQVQLTSFATSVKVLMLQWLDKSESYFGDESSKLSIFDHTIELQQDVPRYDSRSQEYKPGIAINLYLTRDFKYYVFFYYAPTMLIFFLDWLFNISMRAHSEAGSMLIILLAIYTLNIGFKNEIPKVSYITYFDVWAFFCVLPLFFLILVWTGAELMESMGMGKTKKKIQHFNFFFVPIVYATFTVAYWIFVVVNIY